MLPVLDSGEMNHAVNASKGGAVTTVAMRVELFLGQDVAALL